MVAVDGMLNKVPDELLVKAALLATVGSTAHGISATQEGPTGDDLDLMGFFVPPREQVYGMNEAKTIVFRTAAEGQKSQAGDVDFTLHPARKFLKLAAGGNPTTLGVVFSPDQHVNSATGRLVRQVRAMFASRKAGYAFRGYAEQQHQRLLGERGQMKVKRPELVTAYGYDTKYAGHILRLCYQGITLLDEGYMPMPLDGEQREFVLAVRRGEVKFDEVSALITELRAMLDVAIERTLLPEEPPVEAVNELILAVHAHAWQDEF